MKEIKTEEEALKRAGELTCLKHIHAFREGDFWFCIPYGDCLITPKPYTIIKAKQEENRK